MKINGRSIRIIFLAFWQLRVVMPKNLKIDAIYLKKINKNNLGAIDKHIFFTWIPNHIGIHGSTVIARHDNDALNDLIFICHF